MGIYLVVEADNGLILMWDRKTSLFIKLSSKYKVKLQPLKEGIAIIITSKHKQVFFKQHNILLFKGLVCGLCGNYDGTANNDFTTRSHAVVVNPLVFGNSWKNLPSCPDAEVITSPCTANPYRQSWAQKQCSIIQSDVFLACHSIVGPCSCCYSYHSENCRA